MRRWLSKCAPSLILVAAIAQLVPSPTASLPVALDEDALRVELPALAAAEAPGSIEELRGRIGEVLEREGVPGAGIALVGRDGVVWSGGVGVADLETRVPVRGDTVFRVASITKSFVALGVMRLVEQGKLSLDRPLREIVPDAGITNAWEAEAPVTLAQVLEHTAGLDDMRFNETFSRNDAMSAPAALAINRRSRVVRWRPGSRMAYSNVGYTLAARAIEVATGEPFDVWLRREILAPLGMPGADFQRTEALAGRLASGYIGRTTVAPFAPIAHRAAGALLASAADLARLVQFWLRRDGTLVSPAGLARIERCGTLPFARMDVDYGLGNYGDVEHPTRGRGHDGGLPGFVSSLRYFPELGAGYVMLLNATHSARAYIEVRRLLYAYLARGHATTARTVASEPTDRLVDPPVPAPTGFYQFASPRHALLGFIDKAVFGWRTTPTEDGARLDPLFGEPVELVATPDGGFRFPGESGTSLRFARARDGSPAMVSSMMYAEGAAWWPARLRATALDLAMLLVRVAPLWALGVFVYAALRRRRVVAAGLLVWPALASLCLVALPWVFVEAWDAQVIGEVHPWTIAICATTLLFAFASAAGATAAWRWSRRPDRPPWLGRLVPSACALAAFGLATWFALHHIIGLRTWAW